MQSLCGYLKMRVGVIGFRNHASRLASHVLKFNSTQEVILFHPNPLAILDKKLKKINLRATSNFLDILECDAVIISSPSSTHIEYIKKLISSNIYILCEKPLATSYEELSYLESLTPLEKGRIYTNFNMIFSDYALTLKRYVLDNSIGFPIHLSMSSTHGLSYKESFKENWRFKNKEIFTNIFGNVGIHYIHLFEFIFGEIVDFYLSTSNTNKEILCPDNVNIFLKNNHGVSANFFLSYSCPYNKSAECFFSNGILFEKNEMVEIQEPRDTFDHYGRFCAATRNILLKSNEADDSMQRSVNYFLKTAEAKSSFTKKDFNLAASASKLVLKMSNEYLK